MTRSKFLSLDLGAESGRAFVGTVEDGRILLDEIHRFPNIPVVVSGHSYWDVTKLFREIEKSLILTAQRGHKDIVSLGIDTWGVDFGLLRTDDGSIDFPFTYRDKRTDGIMEKVFNKISRGEVYGRTGIQSLQINTLFQLYSMKELDPKYLHEFSRLLFMPDIFNYLLTGEEFSEYTISSTSQLMNAQSRKFDETIFSALGLPMRLMCPIIEPGSKIGKLLPTIAAKTGFGDLDIIAVGSHDTASAVAAVPACTDDWAYLSSGTWSLIGIELQQPIMNQQAFEKNFTNEGGVNGKITFLQNITGLWLLQEVRRIWQESGHSYDYDDLATMARTAKKFRCIIDPSDDSFLNPSNMPEAIVEFCRKTHQVPPENGGEMVRTIFESLSMKYRFAIEKLRQVSGKDITTLHAVGGGSQNDLLNQLTADATGLTVIAGPVEATALGNIMVQAIANGSIQSFDSSREMIKNSFPLKEYTPHDSREWDEISKSLAFDF